MPVFRFTVNGEPREIDTPAARPLLEVLREDLHLTGAKHGCGEGQCRAAGMPRPRRSGRAALRTERSVR